MIIPLTLSREMHWQLRAAGEGTWGFALFALSGRGLELIAHREKGSWDRNPSF